MHSQTLAVWLSVALSASAVAIEKRATCPSYTLVNARGTGEPQGESSGFRTMNSNIIGALSGGKLYNVVYPAGSNQDSSAGTTDIVNHITTTLQTSPNECFILEGYSQGAAAVVNAMSKLTGNNFNAVKGVFLIGDPEHKSGLTCNVDNMGGTTTRNANGLESYQGGIPSAWVAKTLDVCKYGDGVCDTSSGYGVTQAHLSYPTDADTQNLGTKYVEGRLQGTSS